MDFLYSAIAFIIAISVLVTVHEFGHYWVAYKLGVKVLKFSVGFGRPLWSVKRGRDNTEYILAAIPLGGYVKMLDEREGDVLPHETHRAFNRQSLRVRTAIVLAGPVANFLLTIVAYWLMFLIGISGPRPLVGEISPESIAAQGGLEPGSEIISIAGRPTRTWESVMQTVLGGLLTSGHIPYTALGKEGDKFSGAFAFDNVTLDDLAEGQFFAVLGIKPAYPALPPIIGYIEPGKAADRAGLQVGDRIVTATSRIDNVFPISTWKEWVAFIHRHPGEWIEVEISRDNKIHRLSMQPAEVVRDNETVGFIGAAVTTSNELLDSYYATERYGPIESISRAIDRSHEITSLTLGIVWKMLQLEISAKNLSGPISIAQYAGYSAKSSISKFLEFLAIVSLSLGILNLLPIPILDGGHLVYFLAEWIKGTPVSEQAQLYGQKIGVILLIGLMSLAFYNDFSRLLS